jgi:hypothetical protein
MSKSPLKTFLNACLGHLSKYFVRRRITMPGRVSVTIDGTKFNAVDAEFAMGTQKDHAGMPTLQTLSSSVRVRADLNDVKNIPFDTVKKLFQLGNVPDNSKIKEIKVEFWKDDSMQDVICSYKFKGWISVYRVSNQTKDNMNHVLDLELTPVINKEHFQEVTIGN